MFRLVLSFLLVVELTGALAASVMHGLNHGSTRIGEHAEVTADDLLADAEKALADCCDTTTGMASASCFGDLLATSAISPVNPAVTRTIGLVHAGSDFSNHSLAVPTGPPKT